jgi:hypothetical protein
MGFNSGFKGLKKLQVIHQHVAFWKVNTINVLIYVSISTSIIIITTTPTIVVVVVLVAAAACHCMYNICIND